MDFKDALLFRHACKVFDENAKISQDEFNQILEAARLSPSSMGMQPWDLEIIRDKDLRLNLRQACWDQIQLTSAAEVVVIYAKIADLDPNSDYIKQRVSSRSDKTKSEQEAYLQTYANLIRTNIGQTPDLVYSWARAQCFLAAQNMMMQAAFLEIDTCPIEGYDINKLNKALNLNDPNQKRVALILCFGKRIRPAQAKLRRTLDEIIKYR